MILFFKRHHTKKGFTVVELLVTISIIGILTSITFASFAQSQKKARMTKRISDLKAMQNALEFYYAVNKSYPNTNSLWISECKEFEAAGTNVIPGLVPNYISRIPTDPQSSPDTSSGRPSGKNCYLYRSNGVDYAFLDHRPTDFTAEDYLSEPAFFDPLRDGGTDPSIIDGTAFWAWKVYSPGGATF